MKNTFAKLAVFLAVFSSSFAHTPLLSCIEEDNTITCEGGFSDGSSASGVEFYVLVDDKVIYKTKLDTESTASFEKPNSEYTAVFNAGKEHVVKLSSKNIFN